ncbi:MAG TPA: YbhB/YbcL family Raf kinase inhibitor-like protein [Gammaproteobacteria bacterium]|jgi:Raf kinase inhibitor-like YbhB/YbcL family protein|nr:YbhB/YbcL family Raf kinase inhibitor-like protein [Gammaproteobacteria bacterium]
MKNFSCIIASIVFTFSTAVLADTPITPASDKDKKLDISTNGFLDKMAIPTLYTCDGKDVSPQLSWTGVPAKTVSLALIMKDVDAPNGTFYHWVLFNIPKSMTELAEGATTPAGAAIGKNNFNKMGYNGPCPPKGSAHTYIFTLYAIDSKLNVPQDAEAPAVLAAMKNHIVGQADLSGVYSRWIK